MTFVVVAPLGKLTDFAVSGYAFSKIIRQTKPVHMNGGRQDL